MWPPSTIIPVIPGTTSMNAPQFHPTRVYPPLTKYLTTHSPSNTPPTIHVTPPPLITYPSTTMVQAWPIPPSIVSPTVLMDVRKPASSEWPLEWPTPTPISLPGLTWSVAPSSSPAVTSEKRPPGAIPTVASFQDADKQEPATGKHNAELTNCACYYINILLHSCYDELGQNYCLWPWGWCFNSCGWWCVRVGGLAKEDTPHLCTKTGNYLINLYKNKQ